MTAPAAIAAASAPPAAPAAPRGLVARLPALWPAAMLGVFFLIPFVIMVAFSFYHRVEGGLYQPAFELENYARFWTPLFTRVLGFSLMICGLAAVICVTASVPFTWFLSRTRRRAQVAWLVGILSILSLSEVIMGFAWSILLSRSAGVSNLLVTLGILSAPDAWTPSFGALLMGLCFIGFPYSVLMLYPAVNRLDPEITEAARTLGASPSRAFFTVVIPSLRQAILATAILVFVFTLGCYVLPQVLGKPEHWTLSVLITDQAIYQSNIPFAAALAVFLVLVSLALIGLTLLLGQGRRSKGGR
ncbi:ABC transporter permease [Inquilinus limosus]|uniref:ABC transporter permease n=1 Tax=Inquilinus limosus TaxID=171674 RepID=UPI000406A4F1|nr:ABC transporter permease [Inquilinus limosus]